jgi:hypothetical protein
MTASDEWEKHSHAEQQTPYSQEGGKGRFDSLPAWAKSVGDNSPSHIEVFRKI